MRTQALWKVITHIALARGPTRPVTRSRISAAALLVKVMASTWPGCTPRAASRYAMRWASTRVLPEPAPATMSSGPPSCSTASRCCGLSPTSSSSGSAPGRLAPGPPSGPSPAAAASAQVGTPAGVDQRRVGARGGGGVHVRLVARVAEVEAVEEGAHVGVNPTWSRRPRSSTAPRAPGGGARGQTLDRAELDLPRSASCGAVRATLPEVALPDGCAGAGSPSLVHPSPDDLDLTVAPGDRTARPPVSGSRWPRARPRAGRTAYGVVHGLAQG